MRGLQPLSIFRNFRGLKRAAELVTCNPIRLYPPPVHYSPNWRVKEFSEKLALLASRQYATGEGSLCATSWSGAQLKGTRSGPRIGVKITPSGSGGVKPLDLKFSALMLHAGGNR